MQGHIPFTQENVAPQLERETFLPEPIAQHEDQQDLYAPTLFAEAQAQANDKEIVSPKQQVEAQIGQLIKQENSYSKGNKESEAG